MPLLKRTAEEAAEEIAEDIRDRSQSGRKGGYLFMFGAGASYSCGIPLGKDIILDLREKLKKKGKWNEKEEIDNEVREYQWEMNKFKSDEQVDIIREYIERGRATDGRWKLNHCYLVLSEIWKAHPQYPRILLTTNFDPLFHYAMLEQNIEPKLIRYFSEMTHMQPFDTKNFPTIIHLHGYWQNHHLYNSIRDFKNYREKWVERLVPEIQLYGLVIIGYSGHPEDIMMQTLLGTRAYDRIAGDIYWCHLENAQINNEVYAQLDKLGNVIEIPIQDADSFMLKIGEALKLQQIIKISAFASVIQGMLPGFVWEFYNHATVDVDIDKGVSIRIKTHPEYKNSGENYAGIDIYTVQRLFDLSKYSQVIVEYDAVLSEGKGRGGDKFEFKLQSADAAHIEYIPIGQNQEKRLELSLYANDKVDLTSVDRIVIAANCDQIGCGSSLEIKLKQIRWS